MTGNNWGRIAHAAQQSSFKLRKRRKKSAKIRVLKEISRRLAFGLDLPPEAVAYAKGQSLDAPDITRPKQAPSKKRGRTDFYSSRAWRNVRYQAIKRADGNCEACDRSPKEGVVLHADHVKPRSKYPHLALEVTNIQILCEDCNMGKSNKDETDWRPEPRRGEGHFMLPEKRTWEGEAWERFK